MNTIIRVLKIENSVPPLVEVNMFNAVQLEIAKNSKAPARQTADDDYLLTTKLYCAKCGAMMVAQSGTSHTGKVHRYYACVRQKKHKYDKKMLHKDKLESFVVYKTMEFLQNDSDDDFKEETIKLEELESSTLFSNGPPKKGDKKDIAQKSLDFSRSFSFSERNFYVRFRR